MTATPDARPSIPIRKPIDLRAVSLMLMLCLAWGFQQVAIKKVSADIAPIMQLTLRFGFAAAFFAVVVLVREGRQSFADGSLRSGLILGSLFSLEFVCVGESLNYTSAAHSVVFLYTSPIFTALGVQFLPEERLSLRQWGGIAVAFTGIAVAFLGYRTMLAPQMLFGDLLALLGGAAWAAANVALRRGRIGNAAVAKTVLYQVGTATILLWALARVTGQNHVVLSTAAVISVAFQTLVISISSYLLWFWMLRHYLTSRLMLISFLTPLFGVLFGAALLGDKVDLNFGVGSVLVLTGILVVSL
jgi:drug/metabolite transporter (DMT)-like permease